MLKFKDKNNKVLFENFLSLSVLQVISYLLPLLVLAYLTETIGMARIGQIAFALSVIQYFVAFVDYGFKLTGTREIAAHRDDPARVSRIFSTVITIKVLFALVSLVLVSILVVLIPKFAEHDLLIVFSFGAVLGDVLIPIWLFQGMEKMKYMTVLNFLMHSIFFALTLLVIRQESDYVLVPLLQSLGYICAGTVSMILVSRNFKVRFTLVSWAEIRIMVAQSWHVFATGFLPNFYNNSTTFLLGLFAPGKLVGFYDVARKIIDAMNSLVTIITQTYFPLLNRDRSYFGTYKRIIIWSGLVLSAIAIFGAGPIMNLVASDEWFGSLPLIQILGSSPFFMAVIFSYGRSYLLVHRLDRLYMRVTAMVSVIGFFTALGLVWGLLHYGAAIALISSRALFALMCFIYATRHMRSEGGPPSA